ncbi:MAG: trypsin-like peptidase domain-containing protein [Rhodospirillales bacterium]|nr:trypsin-like peptidase domain-containing protein [Rhodospirillales bacterium]
MLRLKLFPVVLAAVFWLAFLVAPAEAKIPCRAPEAVCAAASHVFRIEAYDPEASAVLIEPELLVTNRHVVADQEKARVFPPVGEPLTAQVVPTRYPGDLVLLRVPGLKAAAPLERAKANAGEPLYTIGTDVKRDAIKVYEPGLLVLAPATGKPLARLHHDAISGPGNSGGALVNAKGQLVAVIASGGDGRNEAIPASEIARLKAQSGPEHRELSRRIGEAYRKCARAVDNALNNTGASRQALTAKQTAFIKDQCGAANNRQLWDLAGQAFGRRRMIDDSIDMFARALAQDPNAINSMFAMTVTLHLAGRYADEVPFLRRLVDILPADAQVLRLGVQAGAWGNDAALKDRSLGLLEKFHPRMAPMARKFIEANPAPPKRRGAGEGR